MDRCEPDRSAARHPDRSWGEERDAETESDQLDQVRDRIDLACDSSLKSRGVTCLVDAGTERRVRPVSTNSRSARSINLTRCRPASGSCSATPSNSDSVPIGRALVGGRGPSGRSTIASSSSPSAV